MFRRLLVLLLVLFAPALASAEPVAGGVVSHGIAMHGDLAYGPEAEHVAYANPDAPVGGQLRQAEVGGFDSLNPFIILGRTAVNVRPYVFPQLMARVWDEPFSLYGYVAESIETPEDRSWAIFQLDPRAAWEDGTPITVDDVLFSFETLKSEGLPGFRRNYELVDRVTRVGERGIRFDFGPEYNRETVMLIAMMPVISEAWYGEREFNAISLEPPLSGGPYRIAEIDPGRSITYERVDDWWGHSLLAFRGQNNFSELRYDYYLDQTVAREAFQAGAYNLRREFSAEAWASSYAGFAAARDGRATMATFPHGRPSGMRGFVFNSRLPIFNDPAVREALSYAFDFEYVNQTLLYGEYERIAGMFTNSALAPEGEPGEAELRLLEPWRGAVPDEVFGPAYEPPSTAGPGGVRANLRTAAQMLSEAGWEVQNGVLTEIETGQPMQFEILLQNAADERIALAFVDNLRRLGVAASVRTVDSAQYTNRIAAFDFDMILHFWGVTLSPGAEQALYWSSEAAEIEGTRNYPGVADPAIDALIEALEQAADREALTAAARALDRILMAGHYVVPLYHLPRDYVAWWGDLRRVEEVDPLYGLVLEAWWEHPGGS